MSDRFIVLAFLHLGEDEPLVNQLTTLISKHKFFHVEMGFEDSMYFSIDSESTARMRCKKLDNPNYQVVTLKVSDEQYNTAYILCSELSKNNIAFDNWGMFNVVIYKLCPCCCFCTTPLQQVKSTFCSKIITQIVQQIKVDEVRHLNPNCTTPSDLFDAVHNSFNTVVFTTKINRPNFKFLMR
jgi:hypothetical protein